MKSFFEAKLFVSFFVVAVFFSSNGCGHSPQPVQSSASTSSSNFEVKYDPPLKLYVNEKSINIRSGPGKEYDVIGTAKKRQLISVKGKKHDWYIVQQNESGDGYIYQDLLSSEKPKPEPANAPAAQAPALDDSGLVVFPPRSSSGASADNNSFIKQPEAAAPQPAPLEPEGDINLFGPKRYPQNKPGRG